MKNILVPTDFSTSAHSAYAYAKDLAGHLGASLRVIHVHHPSFDPSNPYLIIPEDGLQEAKLNLLNDFVRYPDANNMEEVITEEMIDKELIIGFAGEEIVRLSGTGTYDMVIMGTSGKGGMLEKAFGSVSSMVARNAHCPVLLIPDGCTFHNYKNILYASNYESADDVLLREITGFAALFSASIHLVHVNETRKKGDSAFEELILEQLFRKKAPRLDFKMVTLQSESIWEGLDKYATANEVDLIVLATRHRKFWDKLTHKSLTKKMVLSAKLPLLVLPIEK